MKLNATHRSAFVRAVMSDVPRQDFNEELRSLIETDNLEQLPKQMKPIYLDKALQPYLMNGSATSARNNVYLPCKTDKWGNQRQVFLDSICVTRFYQISAPAQKKIDALYAKYVEQERARSALEAKIDAVITGCGTLKLALERLPEFKKYLPAEEVKGTMLPAIAGLAADLVAMGWPDGGKKAVAA
jgi:hypothetical protein